MLTELPICCSGGCKVKGQDMIRSFGAQASKRRRQHQAFGRSSSVPGLHTQRMFATRRCQNVEDPQSMFIFHGQPSRSIEFGLQIHTWYSSG